MTEEEDKKERKREYMVKWRENHRERVLEYQQKWKGERNREQENIRIAKWRQKNRERNAEINAKWRKTNSLEYNRTYRKNNPDKIRSIRHWAYRSEKYKSWNKIRCKKGIEIVDNHYITHLLRQEGFTMYQIKNSPELIETKRIIIKTKRLCKTLQTSETV